MGEPLWEIQSNSHLRRLTLSILFGRPGYDDVILHLKAKGDQEALNAFCGRGETMTQATVEILLVEDSEPDILLTQEAFEDASVRNRLHVARDGEEALSFLKRQGRFASAPRPDVILMDINMPRKNGLEVLGEIKASPEFSNIPVLMLTTSQAEEDVQQAYARHANGYVVKPVGFENFLNAIRAFEQFWLTFVRLPRA